MKKTFIFALFLALLFLPVFVQAEEAVSEAGRRAAPVIPLVESMSRHNVVVFEPTRWPTFTRARSDNSGCFADLRDKYSGQRITKDGTSWGYDDEVVEDFTPGENDYRNDGQQLLSKTIDFGRLGLDRYRSTMRVVITWTVRKIAQPVVINPWRGVYSNHHNAWYVRENGFLCHPWHGDIWYRSDEANAYTALFVEGEMRGSAAMTIPAMGEVRVRNPADPTITGSVTLKPEDFTNGEFPSLLDLQVWGYNDTSLEVLTDGERNLVVNIVPTR